MLIVNRVLANNAVDDQKLRLRNNQNLRVRNAANTGDISVFKIDATDKLYFQLQPKFASVATQADDLVNLQTLQDYVSGVVNLKDPVRAAATGDLALTGAGPLVVDDITMVNGNRIGLVNQTDGVENGIYIYAEAAGTYTLTRSTDFDGSPAAEVGQGSTFDVIEGTTNGQKRFLLASTATVVDTDILTFVETPKGVVVPQEVEEQITLNATAITNQYFDLINEVLHPSVMLYFSGIKQKKGTDYTLSDTGGVTRVTLAGDLATAGMISLVNGDYLEVNYERE